MRLTLTKNLTSVFFATCALLMFSACTSDNLVDPDLEGTVTITVFDANTGAPIDGVKLQLLGGPSENTSGSGQATFSGIHAGTYVVRLTKTGFEGSQEPLTVTTSGTEQVVAINVVQTYRLHRRGVSIKGRALLRPLNSSDTTATVSAPGVTVELRLTAAGTGSGSTVYLAPVRTAVTSSTGSYTFDSLPEISNYSIVIPEFSNGGKNYSQASTAAGSTTLLSGQVFTQGNIIMTPTALGAMQVFANSLILANNQGWKFEFSSSVDTSKISASSIQLRTTIGGNTTNITSTRTWSQNFTVLSITPTTGTWLAATTYSVVLTGVRDTQNRTLATTTITANSTP